MPKLIYISHANVIIDPETPVPQWSLSEQGRNRHAGFGTSALARSVTRVFCSDETKAIEAAQAMFSGSAPIEIREGLHENDRSATGFLPPDEFERTATQFFENPQTSIRGWERAVDAQTRIVTGVARLLAAVPPDEVVAVVGHGGVGTLLYCHFADVGISRSFDQPANGGGNVLIIEPTAPQSVTPWTPMEAFAA